MGVLMSLESGTTWDGDTEGAPILVKGAEITALLNVLNRLADQQDRIIELLEDITD